MEGHWPRPADIRTAEFVCDRCGLVGPVERPFAGCPTCRGASTLRLSFSPDASSLRELFKGKLTRQELAGLNPFYDREKWITLGEGATGLLASAEIGSRFGLSALHIKNECCNPT